VALLLPWLSSTFVFHATRFEMQAYLRLMAHDLEENFSHFFHHSFIHSFINGCTALCWALATSSVS
jgi:hypothetical protein